MGRLVDEETRDAKSDLVSEICEISRRAGDCARSHRRDSVDSRFVDWYRLLRVEENAGVDIIKKQYHKFALQIHPDKNKDPKAEIAFKLVSQAYICLSDSATRATFDIERQINYCKKCKGGNPNTTLKSPRTKKMMLQMKEAKTKMKEEAQVIENCLKANAALTRKLPISEGWRKEIPIFNPSNYLFQEYPHQKTENLKKSERFHCLWTRNRVEKGREQSYSPVFECRIKQRTI